MKNLTIHIIIICLTIIFLTGCENLSDPGKLAEKNSLIFVLKSGMKKQKLYLYRNLNISEEIPNYPFGNFDKFFRENANISISDGNNSFSDFVIKQDTSIFFTVANSKYYTNNKEVIFSPSTKYNITINSNGQTITAAAVTPGSFRIDNIINRDTLLVDTDKYYEDVTINWTKSENAKYYTVETRIAKIDTSYLDGELVIINFNFDFPANSSEPIINLTNYQINVPTDADSIRIDVTAYDENSYNYYYLGRDEVGVANAHGVFGAAVLNSVILIIKK